MVDWMRFLIESLYYGETEWGYESNARLARPDPANARDDDGCFWQQISCPLLAKESPPDHAPMRAARLRIYMMSQMLPKKSIIVWTLLSSGSFACIQNLVKWRLALLQNCLGPSGVEKANRAATSEIRSPFLLFQRNTVAILINFHYCFEIRMGLEKNLVKYFKKKCSSFVWPDFWHDFSKFGKENEQ